MKKDIGKLEDGWRVQILEGLDHLFDNQRDSILYGLGHALAVEESVLDVLASSEYEFTNEIGIAMLRAAALLHDVGFAQRVGNWSLDHFEHIQAGLNLASQILHRNPLCREHPERLSLVLNLIEHHDDTTYSFPTATRDGDPFLRSNYRPTQPSDEFLPILQEADSRVHATDDCIREASQEWEEQGLPLFTAGAAPLETWQWMDSIVGNVRLMAKRAVRDAYTLHGRQTAMDSYQHIEHYVKEKCSLTGVAYEVEACPPTMRESSIKRLADKSFDLQIVAYHPWSELELTLRAAPLKYDRTIHPYYHAKIQLQLVSLDDITPMALYVLRNRLEEVLELHDALMATYCLSIWDIPGLLEFRYNSEEVQRLAPPIIENYVEPLWPHSPQILGLVDGLHRCSTARTVGLSKVRAIVAANVPYPLVPLPADWRDIRVYEDHDPPPNEKKRHYRYTTLAEFPFDRYQTSVPVTEDNFQYFFYRDWRALGSRGKRDFHEFDPKRAN